MAYTYYAQGNHTQCARYLKTASSTLESDPRLTFADKQHLIHYMKRLLQGLDAYEGITNIKLPKAQKYEPAEVRGIIRDTFRLQ